MLLTIEENSQANNLRRAYTELLDNDIHFYPREHYSPWGPAYGAFTTGSPIARYITYKNKDHPGREEIVKFICVPCNESRCPRQTITIVLVLTSFLYRLCALLGSPLSGVQSCRSVSLRPMLLILTIDEEGEKWVSDRATLSSASVPAIHAWIPVMIGSSVRLVILGQ